MEGKISLITGALTGIGRATALAFASPGARIVVSGRHPEAGQALVAELEARGAEAAFMAADVRDELQVAALVDGAVARFGRLDVAVNNAGTEGTMGVLTEQTVENYEQVFDTNVLGVLLCLKHEMRVMLAQGAGSIINVSSIAGHVGIAGGGVYIASKHAVEGLTKSAALEGAAGGVRVNAVAPGPIETGMFDRFTGNDAATKAGFIGTVPAQRIGEVDEVAEAIRFLASDLSRYVTGHSLVIDGGFIAQ